MLAASSLIGGLTEASLFLLQTIGRVTGETAEFILQQMAALYAREDKQ
jgi:hypothetical protein